MKKNLLYVFTAFLIMQCAAPKIQVNQQLDFKDFQKKYAVLNFDYQGMNLSSKIAKSAADRLAAQLYVKNKLSVVDRSIVKSVLVKNGIKPNGRLSVEELKKTALDLDADYFILGSLFSTTSIESYSDNRKIDISLNLRILDADSGEVQAMAYHSISSDKSVSEIVKKLVTQIVDALAKYKKKERRQPEAENTVSPVAEDTTSVIIQN